MYLIGVIILLSLFALVLLSSWIFSSQIMDPGPYRCEDISRFVYCGDPKEEFGFRFEDISYVTPDNFEISGWYIPATKGRKRAIVLVHGRGVDRHEMMRYVPPLHNAGFTLLLIDLRNCGKSQKSFNSMGYYEKIDVISAVDFLVQKKRIKTIGILGISLGAATSIMSMARDLRVQAGFFEAGYASLKEVVTEQSVRRYGPIFIFLIPLVLRVFKWRTGADEKEIVPLKDIATIAPRPIFIVHGTTDKTVPLQNGDRLFQAAKEPKKIYIQKDGFHAGAWNLEPKKIEKLATDFFKKHL